jgi:hypothetical protein
MNQENDSDEEMRDEYEFHPGGGVRGKYYERYRAGVTFSVTVTAATFLINATGMNQLKDVHLSREFPEYTLPSPRLQAETLAENANAR